MRGALEALTRDNLQRRMSELLDGASTAQLTVNDKKLAGPMRVRLSLEAGEDMDA